MSRSAILNCNTVREGMWGSRRDGLDRAKWWMLESTLEESIAAGESGGLASFFQRSAVLRSSDSGAEWARSEGCDVGCGTRFVE